MSDFSIVTYTADGTPNVQYAVPFDFISRDHVLVLTAYDKSTGSYGQQLLPTTDFLWVDDTTIEVIALAAGTVFSIVRQTPKDQPLVNWVAGGGALTAEELRLSSLQILFIVQENADRGLATAADADAALEAVSRVVAYDLVANVAAIPANPKDNTYIEVLDTTGIQNFSPLTGMPPGFIGDAGLKARLRYVASGASWRWIDYASINPEERYIRKTAISTSVTSTNTDTVAASAAVKTAMDKAKEAEAMTTALIPAINQNTTTANEALSTANAAMPKAGGTFTGDVNFGTTTATKLPVGTTAQRPTGATGLVRFNTTINQYEGYNGTAWSPIGGGAKVSATAPSPATDGMQWYDLNDGRTYVYVNDGNSSQWVDASPPVAGVNTYTGFKNVIINGLVNTPAEINQRGVSIAAAAVGSYGPDRWKKTGASTMTQIIEEGCFEPGAGYTLSGTGIATQQLTAPASGHWTLPDVPITASKIQLERGNVATPFEWRPKQQELALCQRYFHVLRGDGSTRSIGTASASSSDGIRVPLTFPAPMRVAPTFTATTGAITCLFGGTVISGNINGFPGTYAYGGHVLMNTLSGGTVSPRESALAQVTASGVLSFDAEL